MSNKVFSLLILCYNCIRVGKIGMKRKLSLGYIILLPFIIVFSIIKHFFIGIKFVFWDIFHDKNKSIEITQSEAKEIYQEMQENINNRQVKKTFYNYTGVLENGKKVKGCFSASSKVTLNNFLASEGIKVTSIKKATLYNMFRAIGLDNEKPLSMKELIFWLTQVATYLKAGLTLNDTIRIMSEQASKDSVKNKLYRSILYELTLGESFSVALQNQGKVFPALLINMIKSAEATGDLISTLEDMENYYTEIDKTRKEMISAMIYPTILLVFALAILTFIMVYVIPEFIKVYKQAGIVVSGFTLTIVNMSNYITANISMILLVAFAIILLGLLLYKTSKGFRKLVQKFGMHIPFFGSIIIYHEITLFTKTFASLLKNSVYITSSMEILVSITNNEVYKDVMIETISNIAKGDKISKSFHNKWYIPDVAYYMLVTGESTGELALMMEKVANYYNGQHKARVTNLKSFLEPIMIVILALIVGIIILAVVIPMFSLYGQIG